MAVGGVGRGRWDAPPYHVLMWAFSGEGAFYTTIYKPTVPPTSPWHSDQFLSVYSKTTIYGHHFRTSTLGIYHSKVSRYKKCKQKRNALKLWVECFKIIYTKNILYACLLEIWTTVQPRSFKKYKNRPTKALRLIKWRCICIFYLMKVQWEGPTWHGNKLISFHVRKGLAKI